MDGIEFVQKVGTNVSDWNQQLPFDQTLNYLFSQCRTYQKERNTFAWHDTLESIFIHVSQLLTKEETSNLLNPLQEIRTSRNWIQSLGAHPSTSKKNGELHQLLFDWEIMLRKYVHIHNPFIKVKQQLSVDDI